MTIFRLKQLASTSANAAFGAVRWNYDRAELIADGVVHGIGVLGGLIAATLLIVLTAIYATPFEVTVVSIYVAGLLTMLVLSATYNLWPVSRAKWVLRRFDHSAIYVLIAATYTPLIMEIRESVFATALLIGVWCVAIVGIVLKLALPGRFDRLSVGLSLAMGRIGRWRSVQMRRRPGAGYQAFDRGNRTALWPDRPVLLQRRRRRRLRSAVGKCRRDVGRAMGEKLGDPCDGACLCRAASRAED